MMRPDDVPHALKLSTQANWNQMEADWQRYIALEPDGCFVAEVDGNVCGTVTSIDYERRFAWIGMLLVDPNYRGRGMGTALVRHAIAYLKSIGTRTIKLDATPAGKPIYDKLGFEEELVGERWAGSALASDGRLPRASRTDMKDILALDTEAFGADRSRVIERLFSEFPEDVEIVRDAQGRLLGYAATRPGRRAWYFGPCVARDRETAFRLFESAMARLAGEPLYIDIITASRRVRQRLAEYGFTRTRTLTRMYLGTENIAPDAELTLAVAGFEKG